MGNLNLDLCIPAIESEQVAKKPKAPVSKKATNHAKKPQAVMSAANGSFFGPKKAPAANDIRYGGGGKVGFGILVLVGVFLSIDWRSTPTKNILKEVKSAAVELDGAVPALWKRLFSSSIFKASADLDGSLVHTVGKVSLEVDSGLKDSFFGRDFGDFVEYERIPEYCQWKETSIKKGGVVSYTYEKDWRSELIDSSSFNDPSYTNPQRDPAPRFSESTSADLTFRTLETSGKNATVEGPFTIAAKHLSNLFTPFAKERTAGPVTAKSVPFKALTKGFSEIDNMFYYSRLESDGAEGKWAAGFQTSAGYLPESLLEVWIFKETCNAGDVRVHHRVRRAPEDDVTVLARFSSQASALMPYTFKKAKKNLILARKGALSIAKFVAAESKEALGFPFVRFVLFAMAFVLAFFVGGSETSPVVKATGKDEKKSASDIAVQVAGEGIATACIAWAASRLLF